MPLLARLTEHRRCPSALIAGQGRMPSLVLEGMQREAIKPLILCLDPSNWPLLAPYAGAIYPLSPIQLGKAAKIMRRHGVQEVSLAGRVAHELLLHIRPWQLSWHALWLWLGLKDSRADTVLGAVSDFFSLRGFTVISSLRYLASHLVTSCPLAKIDADMLLGIAVAKTLGGLDVGQSVVVSKGNVVALEALEGTDGCLERVIGMGVENAVLVKMSKPGQDLRFDVPMIGTGTFKRLLQGRFRALVVEKGCTICSEPAQLRALQEQLTVVAVDQTTIQQALQTYAQPIKELSASF